MDIGQISCVFVWQVVYDTLRGGLGIFREESKNRISSYLAVLGLKKYRKPTLSDGRVLRASASGAVDSGLIPSRIKPMTFKLVFTASLIDA